ncbi:MAG: protein kinase [Phycisphaerales bacterium]|nr:protein kinase [Phycisphaerales bacterium]
MPVTVEQAPELNLQPGRVIGSTYVVEDLLGSGWEGEVYKVRERRTDAIRAVKVFRPDRNPRDRVLTRYARKLERLRHCAIVIDYHHTERLRWRNQWLTCMVSEYVEGEVLDRFVRRRGGQMDPVSALHLLHALTRGLEEIHDAGEYHGDLHWGNVLVRRRGIHFEVKVLDLFHWGRPTAAQRRADICELVKILLDVVGGRSRYAQLPVELKTILRGLRKDRIIERFPTASALRRHLDTFDWSR